MSDDLNELGSRVAKALEKHSGDERMLAKVKARFHVSVGARRVPEQRVWLAFAAGAALAATAALIAFVAWPKAPAPLGVAMRGQPGAAADFVLARGEDQALEFSDGSEVVVRSGSQLRIAEVTADGASATLERGSAHVSVVHKERTKWTFTAGPYRVHVVGTKFELRWNPDTTGLQVAMEEGAVEVDGPGMTRQRVAGNGRLELFVETPEPETAEAELPGAEPVAVRQRHPKAKAAAVVAPGPAGSATWRYLADTGDANAALAAAEQSGFSSLVGSLVQQDVLLLGDVARKAKKPARAFEAYNAVRDRFPGSPASIDAAMRMGRLFSDVNHDDVTAAKWFERGFREGPNAPLAAEAMGRWLDALSRTDKTAARTIAEDYLRRFPNGHDVQLARDLAR